MQPTHVRFWAKVDRTGECWIWTGSKDAKGYGHFRVTGSFVAKAHRWAWEMANAPIPDGLTIDHLCRNTSCVNPAHMEVVDSRTNTLRGGNPCAVNARKTHCIRGHELTEENTYRRPHTTGRVCRTCWLAQAKKGWRDAIQDVPTLGVRSLVH